jgi:hypothetical protein
MKKYMEDCEIYQYKNQDCRGCSRDDRDCMLLPRPQSLQIAIAVSEIINGDSREWHNKRGLIVYQYFVLDTESGKVVLRNTETKNTIFVCSWYKLATVAKIHEAVEKLLRKRGEVNAASSKPVFHRDLSKPSWFDGGDVGLWASQDFREDDDTPPPPTGIKPWQMKDYEILMRKANAAYAMAERPTYRYFETKNQKRAREMVSEPCPACNETYSRAEIDNDAVIRWACEECGHEMTIDCTDDLPPAA